MNAWYDDIVEAYGEYCLKSETNESDGNEGNGNGNQGNTSGDNSAANECQDIEPNGNTYCKNVDRYGGCTDRDNRWYFDKYCLKTCNKCKDKEDTGSNKGANLEILICSPPEKVIPNSY